MKYKKYIFDLIYFSSVFGLISIVLLEFNYRLVSHRYNEVDYSALKLHDNEHHFCKGPKDRIIIDKTREYIG